MTPEPVVLVFFGDHKPTLGAGNSFGGAASTCRRGHGRGFYNLYTTPYLIWTNDAAKAAWKKRHWYRPDHLAVLSHVRAL